MIDVFANFIHFSSPEIGNAYAVLSNPEKRRQYDLTGGEEPSSPSHSHRGGFDFHRGFEADITPEDLFNMFFGGGFPSCKRSIFILQCYLIFLLIVVKMTSYTLWHFFKNSWKFWKWNTLKYFGIVMTSPVMFSTASPHTFTNGRTSYSQQTDYRQERTEERGDVRKCTFKMISSHFCSYS